MKSGGIVSRVLIIANDRNNLVVDIMNGIASTKSSVKAVNSRLTKDNLAIIDITAIVSSQEQMKKLIKTLSAIPSVTSVTRAKH